MGQNGQKVVVVSQVVRAFVRKFIFYVSKCLSVNFSSLIDWGDKLRTRCGPFFLQVWWQFRRKYSSLKCLLLPSRKFCSKFGGGKQKKFFSTNDFVEFVGFVENRRSWSV